MSLEAWKLFFEIGGVILLFFTFAFTADAVLTGKWINERQAEQIRNFDRDVTNAKLELGKQQERAAKAEEVLESERLARLALEASLSPRTLVLSMGFEGSVVHRLTRFAGTLYSIQISPNDGESAGLAGQINEALEISQWRRIGIPSDTELPNGVTILARHHGNAAAEMLSEYFLANHIETISYLGVNSAPENTVLIQIGRRPWPYSMNPILPEHAKKAIDDSTKIRKERMETLRKDWHLPPYDTPVQ